MCRSFLLLGSARYPELPCEAVDGGVAYGLRAKLSEKLTNMRKLDSRSFITSESAPTGHGTPPRLQTGDRAHHDERFGRFLVTTPAPCGLSKSKTWSETA